ncbi:MAG: NAD(P)H-dependent oxidoreductase [Sulfitobacter sp.]
MATVKLLGISGTLRVQGDNSKLLAEAARLFGDAQYTQADIKLPLYDGDEETAQGVPASVDALAQQIREADAVLISTPEYNSGPSGVLKNALDWISRSQIKPWEAKPVAVMSAAAGRTGGAKAQMILRSFMVPFRTRILQGPEIHLAKSYEAFDAQGQLVNEMYLKDLTQLMKALRAEIERA